MEFSTLIGGLGIGGLVATFIKGHIDNKHMISKRRFEEKRDTYVNYLNVMSMSQTMDPEEALWARTAAIERVKLCGSEKVLALLDIVSSLPPASPRDPINEMLHAMREDLNL